MKKKSGFTLLELMIAVAIVGVLSVLSLSGLEYFKRKDLRMEAASLMRSITVAQVIHRDRNRLYGNETSLNALVGNSITSSNFLITLPDKLFNGLTNLSTLNLFDNRLLRSFPNETFDDLKNLKELSII